MIDLIHVILLGILEGVTEFLPISSTGHLIVATSILNFRPALRDTFDIFIQLGAVVAVVAYYRRDLWAQARAIRSDRGVQHLWLMIAVAFIPAAILGVLFRGFIKATLFRPEIVAASLIIGGIVILVLERQRRITGADAAPTTELLAITLPQAGMIGLAQTIALIPGVSRAAASIFGGMFAGLSRENATRFSFLLAIPTLGGATLAELVLSLDELNSDDLALLLIGAVVSGIVAYITIRWLLRYIATHSFVPFGIYRIVVGILILIFFAVRGNTAL